VGLSAERGATAGEAPGLTWPLTLGPRSGGARRFFRGAMCFCAGARRPERGVRPDGAITQRAGRSPRAERARSAGTRGRPPGMTPIACAAGGRAGLSGASARIRALARRGAKRSGRCGSRGAADAAAAARRRAAFCGRGG
jgi:hypothetical protein